MGRGEGGDQGYAAAKAQFEEHNHYGDEVEVFEVTLKLRIRSDVMVSRQDGEPLYLGKRGANRIAQHLLEEVEKIGFAYGHATVERAALPSPVEEITISNVRRDGSLTHGDAPVERPETAEELNY